MPEATFYDNTPFEYGYSSKDEIISNMNPLLKQLMELNKGKVFCDIGCGCGRNLVYASKFAKEVIGVDLSKESLAFANDFIQSDNLKLKQGNNLDIPLEDSIADVVVSDGVCHHTGDTIKAFSECVRILKSGGKLYLAVYKKYRYYPLIYHMVGGVFRLMNKSKFGTLLVENVFVNFHSNQYKSMLFFRKCVVCDVFVLIYNVWIGKDVEVYKHLKIIIKTGTVGASLQKMVDG